MRASDCAKCFSQRLWKYKLEKTLLLIQFLPAVFHTGLRNHLWMSVNPTRRNVLYMIYYTTITVSFYPKYFPSYLWWSTVVDDVRPSWCEVTPFSALRSSDFCLNIHRDESPFSSHTVKEALFCRSAVETQRTRPTGWSLCLLCTQIWHDILKHINSVNMLTKYR